MIQKGSKVRVKEEITFANGITVTPKTKGTVKEILENCTNVSFEVGSGIYQEVAFGITGCADTQGLLEEVE